MAKWNQTGELKSLASEVKSLTSKVKSFALAREVKSLVLASALKVVAMTSLAAAEAHPSSSRLVTTIFTAHYKGTDLLT